MAERLRECPHCGKEVAEACGPSQAQECPNLIQSGSMYGREEDRYEDHDQGDPDRDR